MTTRRTTTARPCAHEADVRDCGECVATAHKSAVQHRLAVAQAAPETVVAQRAADCALDDALAARAGHEVLRENGIGSWVPHPGWTSRSGSVPCRRCRQHAYPDAPCGNLRCRGRRVRCQMPEVRS